MIEYCMLIAAVCAAIIGSHIYTKRAIQGGLKASTDSIGEQFSSAWSDYTHTKIVNSKRRETLTNQGEFKSEIFSGESYTDVDNDGVRDPWEPYVDENGNSVYDPPEHEFVYNGPYQDTFAGKRLTEVKLFDASEE